MVVKKRAGVTGAIIVIIVVALSLSACGGGDDAFTGGDGQITLSNFETALQHYSISISGATIIHEDGLQGGSVDVDRVMLGKTTAQGLTDSLALGYSLRISNAPPAKTFVAFYIDSDNDALTGESIAGIGADHLLFDDHAFGHDNLDLYSNYYMWSETQGQWLGQDNGSVGSYHQGTNLKRGVIMPDSSTLGSNLFGLQDIRGVVIVRSYMNSNPNTPNSTIDETTVFTFGMPQ